VRTVPGRSASPGRQVLREPARRLLERRVVRLGRRHAALEGERGADRGLGRTV